MKKVVVIVHPLKRYFAKSEENVWYAAKSLRIPEEKVKKRINPFEKYAKTQKVIVLMGRKDNPNEPWLLSLSPRVKVNEKDVVISDENTVEEMTKEKYPNFDKLVKRISKEVNLKRYKVIVCGFMMDDCVRKVAEAMERAGFKPVVDPQATELYYGTLALDLIGEKGDKKFSKLGVKTLAKLDKKREEWRKKILGF